MSPFVYFRYSLFVDKQFSFLVSVCNLIFVRFLSFTQYYLRILSDRLTSTTNNHNTQERQIVFLGETIKEKTPQLPLRQNQHQNSKRSPKTAVVFCLLSSPKISFFSSAPHLGEQVKYFHNVINRETLTLYLYSSVHLNFLFTRRLNLIITTRAYTLISV